MGDFFNWACCEVWVPLEGTEGYPLPGQEDNTGVPPPHLGQDTPQTGFAVGGTPLVVTHEDFFVTESPEIFKIPEFKANLVFCSHHYTFLECSHTYMR